MVPPNYVKPFVKRHKNDAVDAEVIVEAALRPSMSFVAVKSKEQQAQAVVFRSRDLYLRQRTQLINALREHLAEYVALANRMALQLWAMMVKELNYEIRAAA